jgi:hypothetical protein
MTTRSSDTFWLGFTVSGHSALFQARQELVEQHIELVGVIDKERMSGIFEHLKFRARNKRDCAGFITEIDSPVV